MTAKNYLFISRKSSHYRYYEKLVHFLGNNAQLHALKQLCLPSLNYRPELNSIDLNDLVDVHMKRKEVRYPVLKKSKLLNKLFRFSYTKIEKARANYYYNFLEQHPCTTVILWNGMKQPNRTPYIVAKALGKETILFENGLLPNTTTLDPKGVNALNSVPRNKEFYLNWQGDVEQRQTQLVARAPHKQRKKDIDETKLPSRYIFVPFQVPNDTQIVCHSPWVPNMETFYATLEESLEELKKSSSWQPFKFVIKEHPSWPRNFSELHNKHQDIIFANGNNTQELIEDSLAVITINSTVGMESLLLGKNVITLGNAFFNIDGLVHHCKNVTELIQTLKGIEEQEVDHILVDKFLSYLKSEYLLPQAWGNLSDEMAHFNAVKERLENPYKP
ncbi:capsular biosynthesis protein [Pseudoalteromonas phenolica]|uniref:capsular polysaccharide export protein, LipB/KpsS family n=1 Tax=Pseudoalteromonas phenolica TaxID=161398 RepID=UPI00110B6F64|nr:capsular biosynthesis protein [Pseudoalteromonas phenolica]TMO55480.1 capsular biosynthesis protein [Pseudoalteromonas phenolica]